MKKSSHCLLMTLRVIYTNLGKVCKFGNFKLPLLMYAGDIVILSDTHTDAQEQLDFMTKWCSTWGMMPNIKKTQVLHHCILQRKRCSENLYLSGKVMEYVDN